MKKYLLYLLILSFVFTTSVKAHIPSKGIVVTSNHYASKAAANIIRNGGSAIDAAITAQLVLTMTTPQSTGIGGGAFIIYWDKSQSKLYAIDGREEAPLSAKPNLFLENNVSPMKFYPDAVVGGKSVGVPGLVKLMEETHKKFGKVEWKDLFIDPIKLAEEGFILSPALHNTLNYLSYLKKIEPANSFYYRRNESNDLVPLPVGTLLKNPEYAETLKRISIYGAEDFYNGKTTNLIIDAVNNSEQNAGFLTKDDFKNYDVIWREPLCILYRSYNVCGMPPPAGSISVSMILKMLENYDVKSYSPTSPEFIHLYSEISALAYADRNFFLADPDYIDVPVEGLIDDLYLNNRIKGIDKKRSNRNPKNGEPIGYSKYSKNYDISMSSTSHLVIVDLYGNAVSMTSTVEGPFGSHLMAGGFILNNELTDFSLLPDREGIPVANRVEPGKRPLSSMSPTIIFDKEGNLHSLTGSPGGTSIIGYVTKSILGLLDWGMTPQEAVSIPHYMRKHIKTELEKNTNVAKHKNFLENLGHDISILRKRSGLHVAKKIDGGFIGGADPRREGLVIQINNFNDHE